jgi:hypothetical protein
MFGQHSFGPKADALKSMARISYLYEVYNGLVIDAQMEGFSTSETALCWGHLSHCKPGDLLLFDRYYASHQLMLQSFTERCRVLLSYERGLVECSGRIFEQ